MDCNLTTAIPSPVIDFPSEDVDIVIAQVVFTDLLAIEKPKVAGAFQAAINHDYPFLGQEVSQTALGNQVSWRFTDLTQRWSLVLGRNAVALTCRGPAPLGELAGRLEQALKALASIAPPAAATRVGIRCVSRRPVAGLEKGIVHPEIAGMAVALGNARHAVAEAHVPVPEGEIIIRHAKLSPGTSYAPNEVPPRAEASWVLDVDAYRAIEILVADIQQANAFNPAMIIATAWELARRAAHVMDGCLDSAPAGSGGTVNHNATRH